ncbi:phage protein Gp37 [Marinomonas transparens]|uniref:DUF1834 family protein n=1 Tax=Marinomonas transparens TaxID=2795388 RepID=A0A934JRR8_9GAMM|nr:phage protein Gp37 [Marinomonas transparens]MBJ7537167.1 DUF1834 family protein [Marinomonas transparens]
MFAQVDSAMKAAIQAALGSHVNEVATHPGHWSADVVNSMLLSAPAVYTSFDKGTLLDENKLKSRWHLYLVTKSPAEDEQSSAYAMVTTLLSALHGLDLGQADELTFKSVKNRPDLAEDQTGYQCHEIQFWLEMPWPDLVEVGTLDDFLGYHAEQQGADSDDVLVAADVTL